MAWIVSPHLAGKVQKVRWESRCGMLEFREPREGSDNLMNYAIVGVHGNHNTELLYEDLAAANALARTRRRDAQLIMVGDWNIDQLPETTFADFYPEVKEKHNEERRLLQDLARAICFRSCCQER